MVEDGQFLGEKPWNLGINETHKHPIA